MIEEACDLLGAEIARVSPVVKADEPPDPADVDPLGPGAVIPRLDLATQAVEQTHRGLLEEISRRGGPALRYQRFCRGGGTALPAGNDQSRFSMQTLNGESTYSPYGGIGSNPSLS